MSIYLNGVATCVLWNMPSVSDSGEESTTQQSVLHSINIAAFTNFEDFCCYLVENILQLCNELVVPRVKQLLDQW